MAHRFGYAKWAPLNSALGHNMNQQDAAAIATPLEAAISQLATALREAEARLDEPSFESFKRVIGLQIGNLSFELLDPIYAEHPDLAPKGVLDK